MRQLVSVLFALALVAAMAAGVAFYVGYTRLHEPYKGYAAPEVFVEIPSGAGPIGIGDRLVEAGVVRDRTTFRAAVWLSGRARALQAGEYRFAEPMTPMQVVDRLARGDVYRRPITFPEGLTMAEMAQVFAREGFGEASAFLEAARDPSPIAELDPEAEDLEGYLFPETYSLPRGTSARTLVAQMVALFKQAVTPEMRQAYTARGLTLRQAVTMASLVEEETALPEERALVAAVYLNRHRLGMPLQADPTVIYALQREGRYDGNIRRDDLQFDSPYNTYRYPGLPPGPIASPGKGALEAVALPADVDYLYFVSRNDGSHVFARTLDEHNRNVRRWQIEYFRRQRNRQ
jgi:UPF0755 protein